MAPLQPKASHLGLILPLCTSSATVGLALFQYPVFMAFLQSNNAGKPLSRYWDPMLKQGASLIGALGVTTAIAGGLSARWLRSHATLETTDVSNWYIYGSVLAAGHLAFIPVIAGPVKRMIDAHSWTEDAAEESNRKEMKTWFTIHTVRLFLVDLPALWFFAEGAALSFWVI